MKNQLHKTILVHDVIHMWSCTTLLLAMKETKKMILPAQEENVNPENIILVKDNEVLSLGEHAVSLTC